MSPIKQLYNYFIDEYFALRQTALGYPNPALWLYNADVRSILFRIQALSRIAKKVYKDEIFIDIYNYSKDLEDRLGLLDYYVVDYQQQIDNKKMPKDFLGIWHQKATNSLGDINFFVGKSSCQSIKMNDWKEKLDKVKFFSEKKEKDAVEKFLKKESDKIQLFLTQIPYKDIEHDIHEARRKLRWMSIYYHCLGGWIELKDIKSSANEILNKYLTDKILNSPFNSCQNIISIKNKIYYDLNHFYALSWVISELGEIKDEGLFMRTMISTQQEIDFSGNEEAISKVKKILGKEWTEESDSLLKSKEILESYISNKLITKLLK